MKILVVDDEIEIVNALKKYLESKGCAVDYALDGKEALQLIIQETDYDIIFLDVNMPGLTGIEILKYIREYHVKAKVIVLTGYPGVTSNFCALLGADEYLEKPTDLKVIGELVDKYTQS